jgi:hypothetical protein
VRWPWIGREHHEDVVSAKNAQIRWQQETIAALEARIAQPVPVKVTVQLPDDFAVMSPAIVASRRRKPIDLPKKEDDQVDWASLDENNPEDLAKAAAKELGGPANPYVLAQTVARIKANIVRDKYQKSRRTLEEASVGTIPESGASRPDYVPAHVQRMIDAAEGK